MNGDLNLRIVYTEAGDHMFMTLKCLNYDNTPHGSPLSLDMTLNGTTNVETVFWLICMVNNVYPTDPTIYPAGEITVSIDCAADNSFSFVIGKFTKGKWQSALHLVPYGRKLAVTRMFSNNQLDSSETHIHTLSYIQNYTL